MRQVKGDGNGVVGTPAGKAPSKGGLKVIIAGAPASGKGTQVRVLTGEKFSKRTTGDHHALGAARMSVFDDTGVRI